MMNTSAAFFLSFFALTIEKTHFQLVPRSRKYIHYPIHFTFLSFTTEKCAITALKTRTVNTQEWINEYAALYNSNTTLLFNQQKNSYSNS
jgi:hypothetical protein